MARYLGYGKRLPEPEVEDYITLCEREICALEPRCIGRKLSRSELPFDSLDLKEHIRHCTDVWLIALTLGSEADRLLRRWSVEHIGKAAVGQACAAVWMDDCCHLYLSALQKKLSPGEYLLPPYSPGYGDFPLSDQKPLLALLDAGRKIGVALTDGGMLVPEKTITAVVGITTQQIERCVQKCGQCPKIDCKFRMC